jgi:hypothetical protein
VRPRKIQGHIPSIHIAQAKSDKGQDLVRLEFVNAAQGVKLVDITRAEYAVFYLSKPSMGYATVTIILFLGNLMA